MDSSSRTFSCPPSAEVAVDPSTLQLPNGETVSVESDSQPVFYGPLTREETEALVAAQISAEIAAQIAAECNANKENIPPNAQKSPKKAQGEKQDPEATLEATTQEATPEAATPEATPEPSQEEFSPVSVDAVVDPPPLYRTLSGLPGGLRESSAPGSPPS